MHFEIIRINNLKRVEQAKESWKMQQLVLAKLISDSRHDVIFWTNQPKNAYLKTPKMQTQMDLWKLQIITAHVTGSMRPSGSQCHVQMCRCHLHEWSQC